MGATDSMACRYNAPATRPAPYLFLRDRQAERREGLLVAGRLLCPWPQLTDQRRDELTSIEARLAKERGLGLLGPLGSWVTEERIVAFKIESIEWLRRMAFDGLRIPVRVPGQASVTPPTAA
jgi:hypothetical protein